MRALRCCLVAAVAAVFGCAASPPPPPHAMGAPPAPMGLQATPYPGAPVAVRWQQFCEQATSVSQASWLVSSRGADGWELAGMYNGVLCYKRPEPTRSPPAAAPPAPPQVVVDATQPVPPAPAAAPSPGAPSPGPVTSASQSTVPRVLDPGF